MIFIAIEALQAAPAVLGRLSRRNASLILSGLLLYLPAVSAPEGKTQAPPGAAALYQITDLGPASRSTDDITPALDQSGRVLTWFRGSDFVVRAWLWNDGKQTELPALPGYSNTYAADINGNSVVGTSRATADTRYYRAFLGQNGHMEDIGTLGGKYARAYAVNAMGQVVGGANTAKEETHAFLRDPQPASKLRDLGTLAAGNYSVAEGINRSGQVIGTANLTPNGTNHAFLWEQGQMQDLGALPGGSFSYAHAINDSGQVAGWGNDAKGEIHAVLWEHGKALDLGVLGDDPSSAWGINNRGQVVGASGVKPNRPLHAVLWENGHVRDLNDLIPANSGWRLQFAYRINDAGQIVGIGIYKGEIHAYLLTPPARKVDSARPQDPAGNAGLPTLNGPVLTFSLRDTEGQVHSLAEFKGRRVALYFFCGCERCQQCAQTWGQLQRSGVVAPLSAAETTPGGKTDSHTALTVVVFMGDAEAAVSFARTTGLDLGQTLLLADPKMDATGVYHALPCPRVFVLDQQQIVRYVNSHEDDDPLQATAATIDTRALEALKLQALKKK